MQRILDQFNDQPSAGIDTCALLRCTARLHLSVLGKSPDSIESIFMLCSVFRSAALYTGKLNEDEASGPQRECPFEECMWFEKTSFNVALQHAEQWPAKAVVDILAHSSAMTYPRTVSAENTSKQVRHRLNAAFLQAVVLLQQARSWNCTNNIEDIPRTSYHARSPPEADRLQYHLYEGVLQRYHQLRSALTSDAGALSRNPHEGDLASKTAALLPLAFEAQLFTILNDTLSVASLKELPLMEIIDNVSKLPSSSQSDALLADLILSSFATASGPVTVRMPARLPPRSAITLLGKLITVMRSRDNYDITKAARWIRCVVGLVLDAHSQSSLEQDDSLQLIATIVAEAVQLARSSATTPAKIVQEEQRMASAIQMNTEIDLDTDMEIEQQQRNSPALRSQAYPSDELQWLSTTLFNLAVDLYTSDAGPSDDDEQSPQTWATRAVELADILASRGADDGGDGGKLASVLRGKGRQVGWSL